MADNSRTILDLETRFWQSMVDKDAKAAKAMIADECLITGPMGAMKIDPAKYEKMTEEGQWTLDSFELSDSEVIFPSDDVAVVAYKVRQKGQMKDKPMDMHCADSSTWIRDGDAWKCALHTETALEDA
ncbi:MAG: nuclear transport factor 2 family protein [Amaricoccus sp.]